jgi:hypothetical protein
MKCLEESRMSKNPTLEEFFLVLQKRVLEDLRDKNFLKYEISVARMSKGDIEIKCSFAESTRYVIAKEGIGRLLNQR